MGGGILGHSCTKCQVKSSLKAATVDQTSLLLISNAYYSDCLTPFSTKYKSDASVAGRLIHLWASFCRAIKYPSPVAGWLIYFKCLSQWYADPRRHYSVCTASVPLSRIAVTFTHDDFYSGMHDERKGQTIYSNSGASNFSSRSGWDMCWKTFSRKRRDLAKMPELSEINHCRITLVLQF